MKLGQKLAVNYIRARLNLLAVVSPKKAASKAFKLFTTPFYRTKKQAPPVFKHAKGLSIDVKGNTVRGYKWNAGGQQRILILHGFESSCKNFDAFVRLLLKHNYEVLAFDAPAHGSSGGKHITLPLYIDMIETIHYKFGGLQGIIAHSFGGLAAALFAEKLKDNSGLKMVLIAPLTKTTAAIDSFFRFLQLSNGVRAEFNKILELKSGYPAGWFSMSRVLPQLTGPVLWVQDTDDDITPMKDAAPLMEMHLPNIRFYITHGLGHKKIYRDAKVIQQSVDFLDTGDTV